MTRATWFCIDIEASGPVPELYDMISLGASVVTQDEGTFAIGESWYAEIIPTGPLVDPGAMAVNGLDIDELKTHGQPLKEALASLARWTQSHTRPGTKPVFVGHNAPFDWSFVAHGYARCEMENPFGYKALDTKALAMGILGVHWFDANKELLDEQLTLPAVEHNRVHRADYDAWYQAHILVELLRKKPSCADL